MLVSHTVVMIKSRIMILVGHVEHMGTRKMTDAQNFR
jgi:hypothetical protein